MLRGHQWEGICQLTPRTRRFGLQYVAWSTAISKYSARLSSALAAPATGSAPRTRFVLISSLISKHNCIIHLRRLASAHSVSFIKFICCAPRTSPWAAYLRDNHYIAYKLLENTGRRAFRQPAVRLTVNPRPRKVGPRSSLFEFLPSNFIHSVTCASFRAPYALNIALST